MSSSAELIVIPVHNEGARLNMRAYSDFLEREPSARIVFVNDGSTDNTGVLIDTLRERHPGQVHDIVMTTNTGKAEAVRRGLLWAAAGGYSKAAFLDADLAAPLETAAHLFAVLDGNAALDCVIGSRVKLLGWSVCRSELRHYLGRVFATAASLTLALPVYDTQCGAKALRLRPEVIALLRDPFMSRWLFDVELIARIRDALGPAAMREFPLSTWVDRGDSKVRLSAYLRAPWELLGIRRRYPPN